MYRYSVDSAVTYASEDFVLFRESPFACWMERLTLENPDHGIAPDAYAPPPAGYVQRQDELAATLRDEGKHVALIDWDAEEPVRRATTLDAMRRGTDYIVNGQLALGPLSGAVNLLMRTSGYSELGNFLYIPCDTQAKTTLNSAFRLCFAADLLQALQGQLPPQMLIIRGDADLLPLQTEDHIYHYRAVKQRFMAAMGDFSKHRMPDPAESSHFGRWSECAHEVLKQRALRDAEASEIPESDVPDTEETAAPPAEDLATLAAQEQPSSSTVQPQPRIAARGIPVGDTLAAQARKLPRRAASLEASDDDAAAARGALDAALQNLEFIGSSGHSTGAVEQQRPATKTEADGYLGAQQPVEPSSRRRAESSPGAQAAPAASRTQPHYTTVAPSPPPPRPGDRVMMQPPRANPAAAQDVSPAPTLNTHSREFDVDCIDDSDYQMPMASAGGAPPARNNGASTQLGSASSGNDTPATTRPFSSSLNTSNFPEDPL